MIRWLLWNLVCWRGRRCADLLVEGAQMHESVDPALVVGTSVKMEFRCAGCGTLYRRDALLTGTDSVVHLDRVRVG